MKLEEVDDMVIRELEKRHVMIFSYDDLLDLIPNYEKHGDTIREIKNGTQHLNSGAQ